MIDFSYLYKGLCGMTRAHRANVMTGHLGAAVAAGYFIGEDQPSLNDQVSVAIEGELDRIMAGEEKWFDPKQAGITVHELFEPLPKEPSRQEQISTIAEALSGNIEKTRQSGHNVIFASIAIRALHGHPENATPHVVAGIRNLMEGFNDAGPGRGYYGRERGWIPGHAITLPGDDFPPYQNEHAMAEVVLDELMRTASVHRQGYGGLWHIINHAAALTELSRFGYKDLAHKGLAAHHHHVRLWRTLPDVSDELGATKQSQHDPLTAEFWRAGTLKRDSARLTHRIKTLYGFFRIADLVQDEAKRKAAEEHLRYLM